MRLYFSRMQSSLEKHLSRLPWYHAAIAALVYATTIAPTISHTDSGELAAVAYSGGVAHPTGYPLFTLLGWLWTRIPILTPALQLNILCLLFVAFGVFFFSKSLGTMLSNWTVRIKGLPNDGQERVLAGQYMSQTVGALLLAFGQTFWLQSTSLEVYSLHILLLCLNFHLLLKAWFAPKGDTKPWLWLAGGLALGFANHLSFFAILAPVAVFFFLKEGLQQKTFLTLAKMLGIFIPILVILYLYIPLRAAADPALNWGNPTDGESFWYHVTGKQFQVWMFTGAGPFADEFLKFAEGLLEEFYLGLILLLPGLWHGFAYKRKFSIAITSMMVVNILYACNYHIKDLEPYFLPTFIVMAVFMAMGIRHIWIRVKLPAKARPVIGMVLGLAILFEVALNHGEVNQRDQWQYEDYARASLNSLPPHAVVITKAWDVFVAPAYYLQEVEGVRTDVDIVEYQILHDRHWYPNHLKKNAPELSQVLATELEAWDQAVDEFDLGGKLNPYRLGTNFSNLINGMFTKLGNRPIAIGPEIFPATFGADQIQIPQHLTLFPSAYFYELIPADQIYNYRKLPEESNAIRLPNPPHESETEFMIQIWADMMAQRAVYELLFDGPNPTIDHKGLAKQLIAKVKEIDPKRQLPRTLQGL